MAEKNKENWYRNYQALLRFVEEHRHLPQKKVWENRGLLNWWKYNKRCRKAGKLNEEQVRLLDELKGKISLEHTGGRRRKIE